MRFWEKHVYDDANRLIYAGEDSLLYDKNRMRIDPPDKVTKYDHIHLFDENKNPLDIKGNIVNPKSKDAHIPYKK